MYLSKEKFTCPKEQISLYFSVLKQYTLAKIVRNQISIKSIVNSVDPDQLASLINSVDPIVFIFIYYILV